MKKRKPIIKSNIIHPVQWSSSDRLYFGTYFVQKKVLSAKFDHPILGKNITHRFHIGHLHKVKGTNSEYQESIAKRKPEHESLIRHDLSKELQLFCPNPSSTSSYYFFEVAHNKDSLPLHLAIFYTRDCYALDVAPTKQYEEALWSKYLEVCREELNHMIYEQEIHASCIHDLFDFFYEFGFSIYEWLNEAHPNYLEEPLDSQWLQQCKNKFSRYKDKALKSYTLSVLQSIYDVANKKRQVSRCGFCNRYIDYRKGKKFCSLLAEKRDCAKKARNKRYYEHSGKKRLSIYREKTKELRAFYKDRKVTKYPALK